MQRRLGRFRSGAVAASGLAVGLVLGGMGVAAAVDTGSSTTTSTTTNGAPTTAPSQTSSTTTTTTAPAPRVAAASVYPSCNNPNPGDGSFALTVSGVNDLGFSSAFWPAGSVQIDSFDLAYARQWTKDVFGDTREVGIRPAKATLALKAVVSTDGVDGPITKPLINGFLQGYPNVSISTPHCSRNGVDGTTFELSFKAAAILVDGRSLGEPANSYTIKVMAKKVSYRYTGVSLGSWATPMVVNFAEGGAWDTGSIAPPASPLLCVNEGTPSQSEFALSLGSQTPTSFSSVAWPIGSLQVSNVSVRYAAGFVTDNLDPVLAKLPSVRLDSTRTMPTISFDSTDPLALYDMIRLNLNEVSALVASPTCTRAGVAKSAIAYSLVDGAVSDIALHYDGSSVGFRTTLVGTYLHNSTTLPTGTGTWGLTSGF